MGDGAPAAVLAAVFQISVVPAAVSAQGVEGAETEEAVKGFGILRWMAWKILTLLMRKKSVLLFLHIDHLP